VIKEGKFGTQEAIFLIMITIFSKVFYTSPSVLARFVGNAGWYTTLISASVAAVGFTFVYLLLKQFPNKDIVEIYNISLGPYMGFMFSSILALYMMFDALTTLREFTEVLKVYVLPLSPPSYLMGMLVIAVVILSLHGIETIARVAKLNAYTILIGFFIVIILGWQNYRTYYLYPIYGYGLDKVIYYGISRNSAYGEVIILAIIARSLQGIKYIKRAGYISLILSGMLISISLLSFTLSFAYTTAEEITAPMYEMTSRINYGRFLQRIEPVFVFVWNVSSIISIIAMFYAFVSVYCKMFKIQDTKPVVIASAVILYFTAMIQKGISEVALGSVQNIRMYGGLIIFLPPLITLIVAIVRKRKGAENV